MMITLNLSGAVLGLDGEALKDDRNQSLKMHHIVADALSKCKGEPLKAFDLATRIWKEPSLSVDEADFEFIRAALLDAPIFPLIKVPIIRALDKARRETERADREAPAIEERPRPRQS